MILLDTSMISKPLRRLAEAHVIEWVAAQPLETLYLCAIILAELRAGRAMLPAGKRRNGLHDSLERRVLPPVRRSRAGRSIWIARALMPR